MGLSPDPAAARGGDVKRIARVIAEELVAPGFAIDSATTCLLLNSLVSAYYSQRRIYLNAFQRSGEVLDHFGHRLQRLEYQVHSLDPWSMIPVPKAQDVIISLSGSLETEPVLVTLLHADREGLYRFVITSQTAAQVRQQFQSVLPVHIPGVTAEGRAVASELRAILPLGGLFELRTFLYLEAVAEILASAQLGIEPSGPAAAVAPASGAGPSPALIQMLGRVRAGNERVPSLMTGLADQYQARLELVAEQPLGQLLGMLLETARKGHAVYVTAYGRHNEIGGMFAHRLANLGIPVAMTPTRIERPTEPDDLLVALTGSGGTYEVLQRLSGARRVGLKTVVLTAVADSPAAKIADVTVLLDASVETLRTERFAKSRVKPDPVRKPTESTFGLNALLTLEAMVAALMHELGKCESDLKHTDPWQGFDVPSVDLSTSGPGGTGGTL